MAWYSDIVAWADPYIDTAAEYIGYTDEIIDSGMGEVGTLTAGRQFIDDAEDVLGFIKKGANAYGKAAGLFTKDAKGNKVRTDSPMFKQVKHRSRSLGQMGLGSSRGTGNYAATQTAPQGVGYNNPQIRTAMSSLMQNVSNNQQMSQLMAQFAVRPTVSQNRQFNTGSQKLNRSKKGTV